MQIKSALIGHTGFIGSNLKDQFQFDEFYNSKNINKIVGMEFDLLVCSGVSAVKWFANQEPDVDIANIQKLTDMLKQVKSINHLVLISTIDVYDNPIKVNEDSVPNCSKQDYYGKHRHQLEEFVSKQSNIKNYTIIRLPALFGKYLKKNLIFDIMNPLATSINKNLWGELQIKLNVDDQKLVRKYYQEDELGNFQQQVNLGHDIKNTLVETFAKVGFSTLNFADSRSSFQFYNLANLWHDIQYAIASNICKLNLSCEPLTAKELVEYVIGGEFNNHTSKGPVKYDMYSKYASDGKYLYLKSNILEQIKEFIEARQ